MRLLLVCFLLSITPCAANPINIYTEDFPPYQVRLSPKKVEGVSTALITKLLDRAELKYRIQVLPWYRSYREVQKHKNSLIYSLARTEERETKFHWIMPLCDLEVSFFWNASRTDMVINSIDDMRPFVVAVASGQPTETHLLNHAFSTDNNLVIVASHEQGVGLLAKSRVDAIFSADLFIGNIMEEDKSYADLKLKKHTLSELSKPMYLAANINSDPEFVAILQKAAQEELQHNNRKQLCDQSVGHYLNQ